MEVNIEDIKQIAKQAGEKIMEFYKNDIKVYKKEDDTPVTKADLESNKIIEKGLKKYGYPILSEEIADDRKRLKSKRVWIIDPLDGTEDFIQKTGEFAVMIGLAVNGKSQLGVVYEPVTNCLYWGVKNKGAFLEENGEKKKLKVSSIDKFSQMSIFVSRNHTGEKELDLTKELGLKKSYLGSCGVKISRIAEGEGEVYINSSDKTSQWDTCAGAVILQEAGGKITDTQGNELVYNIEETYHLSGIIVSNRLKHRKIVKSLGELD